MNTRVTIYDIAREAKVGIGTVSRVLNNHPSVALKTRERVESAAKRLRYQPLSYTRWLTRRHSKTIAVIIPFFAQYFFVEVLGGIQDKVHELGYDLILCGGNDAEQVEANISRALEVGKVDGILFISTAVPEKFIPKLKESGLPVVLADAESPGFDSITVANSEGAFAATTHLIDLGYRSIGMIGAQLVSRPMRERLDGFKRALKSRGIPFSDELVRTSTNKRLDGFSSRGGGYEAMSEFLKMGTEMPKAFFVSSDIQAFGAMAALADHGLRVPEDVAMVGFDDIELAQLMKLTTMRQPMYQMGVLAVERYVARMTNPEAEVLHTRFTPTLIVRSSCGAALKHKV